MSHGRNTMEASHLEKTEKSHNDGPPMAAISKVMQKENRGLTPMAARSFGIESRRKPWATMAVCSRLRLSRWMEHDPSRRITVMSFAKRTWPNDRGKEQSWKEFRVGGIARKKIKVVTGVLKLA